MRIKGESFLACTLASKQTYLKPFEWRGEEGRKEARKEAKFIVKFEHKPFHYTSLANTNTKNS